MVWPLVFLNLGVSRAKDVPSKTGQRLSRTVVDK